MGVVDQPLPAHRRARFLEVNPHDDEEIFPVMLRGADESLRIIQCGGRIVNGAWSDHDEETIVPPVDDVGDGGSSTEHQRGRFRSDLDFFHQRVWLGNLLHSGNADIVCVILHGYDSTIRFGREILPEVTRGEHFAMNLEVMIHEVSGGRPGHLVYTILLGAVRRRAEEIDTW